MQHNVLEARVLLLDLAATISAVCDWLIIPAIELVMQCGQMAAWRSISNLVVTEARWGNVCEPYIYNKGIEQFTVSQTVGYLGRGATQAIVNWNFGLHLHVLCYGDASLVAKFVSSNQRK